MRTCSVFGCNRAHKGLGLCNPHYRRMKLYGDPLGGRALLNTHNKGRQCLVSGCELPSKTRGLCRIHYALCRRNSAPVRRRTENGEAFRFFRDVVLLWEDEGQCLIWPYGRTAKGYARFNGDIGLVCPRVCESVHGPAPSRSLISAHSCGRGHEGCCNPHHLSWKTHKANMADQLIHGTRAWGERCGSAKLKLEDIPRIRALAGTMSKTKIGGMFGVSRTVIRDILNGRTWAGACPPKSGVSQGPQLSYGPPRAC